MRHSSQAAATPVESERDICDIWGNSFTNIMKNVENYRQ